MQKLKLILSFINKEEKKTFFFLIFLTLISMLLEVIGISSVIPLLSILFTNDLTFFFEFLNLKNFDYIPEDNIILITLIIIGFFFILKNLTLALIAKISINYIWKTGNRLSSEIYHGVINLPYNIFKKAKTEKLIFLSTRGIELFRDAILLILTLITEIIIVFGIFFFLFIINPKIFLVVASIMVPTFFLFYWINKKKNLTWGTYVKKHEKLIIKNLFDSFNSIKEIKLRNVENFFFNQHKKNIENKSKFASKHNFNIFIPKFFFEVVVITAILIIILIFKTIGLSSNETIAIVSLYVASFIRLFPSSFRLINTIQNLNFGLPSLEELNNQKNEINKFNVKRNESQENLEFEFENFSILKGSFKFEENSSLTLKDLHFEIKKGQIIGLKGETGSGKSTFLDIFSGLINLNEGTYLINGKDYKTVPDHWKKSLSYVPQNISLIDGSIKENIIFGLNKLLNEKEFIEILEICQLRKMISRSENNFNLEISSKGTNISGGEKQRIGIARALYLKKKILILDEATNALDENTEIQILNSLRKIEDLTILIVSHKKSTLDFCDQVYELNNLKISKVK